MSFLHRGLLLCYFFLLRDVVLVVATDGDSVHVGGWGEWTYVYEPNLLPIPRTASIEHAHGIHVDHAGIVVITYQDASDPSKCLLRWKPPYDRPAEFLGPGTALCEGTPHGLMASVDEGIHKNETFLYHANNAQALHKTTTEGVLIWSVHGSPPIIKTTTSFVSGTNRLRTIDTTKKQSSVAEPPYAPTWLASEPGSPYVFLADGYGSNRIFVLNKQDGMFVTDHVFGGPGTRHGTFQTCHGMNYWSSATMVICDRENHRLEYFRVNSTDPSHFEYLYTESFLPYLVRPCMIRSRTVRFNDEKETTSKRVSIVAALEGSVGVLMEEEKDEGVYPQRNRLISFLNITEVLGDDGFLHPHDVHFLPNGDFVLVTWNPGRVGYFRRIKTGSFSWSYGRAMDKV